MTLAAELTLDPLGLGYAALIPDCPGNLVDMMNAPIYNLSKPKLINARGLLAAYGMAGAVILDKLEAAGAVNSAVKWAMKFMDGDGIDAGSPVTRGLMLQLAAAGVLTSAEAVQINALSMQPASRAEMLGLPSPVTEAQVRAALGL